ncbi:MAG TPA: 4-hydroxythreonine-4-phosphate dehydrogenase PdxA [Thermodesulfobacteriota bacterium]|nr:4-hydroxythreonine-4-phosphate dehydrogenase PdxA [Thermodesulfobacteriota bacterium]
MNQAKPTIAVTMGDPRGIGPEVLAKALAQPSVRDLPVVVIGDAGVLKRTVAGLGLNLDFSLAQEFPFEAPVGRGVPVLAASALPDGFSEEASSRAAFAYVETAGRLVLEGRVSGIVTGPVSKEAISRSGIPFQGHTEYLAGVSGTREFVMMLAGDRLKVSLVTTHLALSEVSRNIKEENVFSVIRITGAALRDDFGVLSPRLAVTALNPHAGEGGLFGTEEAVILRAIRRAQEIGIEASGPWPADSLFHRAAGGEFDAVVSMYHDQGLVPLKLLHFDSAVNVTLGLPFVRTSVDHGTAFDIAGKGIAGSRSMEAAIRMAAEMAARRAAR